MDEFERPIPQPPPPQEFDSFEDLYNFLQSFYRDNGAALVKKNAGNYIEVDGRRFPTRYSLVCDRGASRPPRGEGVRKTATSKVDCQFKLTASATRKSN